MSNLEEIHNLASELYDLRTKKKQLEDQVSDVNSKIKNLEEHKINELMLEEQLNGANFEDIEVSRSVVFRGGYTKHTDRDAFKFLFDSNNDGALKQHLIIDLAACPRAEFVLMENDIPYKVEYSIHHATLSSILKELVATGQFTTEDIETYSVYVQPQIKVKQKN